MNSFRFEPKHGLFRNVTPVSMKKMKTMRFCNKTKSVNPLKNRDLGVKSKKWFLKNVAPPEIDKNGQFVMFLFRLLYHQLSNSNRNKNITAVRLDFGICECRSSERGGTRKGGWGSKIK